MTLTLPILVTAQKGFLWDVKGKLCSKFGKDRSKIELAILSTDAGWTPDEHTQL